ncbi:MAG TPA: HTH domain-containing protein [Candidatus Elarobacter sp.]|nr:HTH domain-containing protein [Candidatus Elarobacter sp.]
MTTAYFDAPASTTPRRTAASSYPRTVESTSRKIIRLVWLITRLVRRDRVDVCEYERRFGVSLSSFRRDVAILRDAGLYIDADPDAGYRLICFRPEADAS